MKSMKLSCINTQKFKTLSSKLRNYLLNTQLILYKSFGLIITLTTRFKKKSVQ